MVLALLMPMAAGAMTVKVMNDSQERTIGYFSNDKGETVTLKPYQEIIFDCNKCSTMVFHFPGMKDSYGEELFITVNDNPDVAYYIVVPGGVATVYNK